MPDQLTVSQEGHVELAGVLVQEHEEFGVLGPLLLEGDVDETVGLPEREDVELGRGAHQKDHIG